MNKVFQMLTFYIRMRQEIHIIDMSHGYDLIYSQRVSHSKVNTVHDEHLSIGNYVDDIEKL